jgi:hypothetical protein
LTLLIDAAPLVALADPHEPRREQILGILRSEPEALVIPNGSDRILSFDERHFRSVGTLGGAPFVILPADLPG